MGSIAVIQSVGFHVGANDCMFVNNKKPKFYDASMCCLIFYNRLLLQEEAGSYLSTVVQTPLLVIDEADKMVEKGHFEELTKILTLMKG